MVLFTLFDNILHNLIDKDIKRLNVAYTATRNNRDCSVELFEFVNKAIHFLLLLFPTLLMRLKSIKNQESRLYVRRRKGGSPLKLILHPSLKILSVCIGLWVEDYVNVRGIPLLRYTATRIPIFRSFKHD
jgi:hypothetical protein